MTGKIVVTALAAVAVVSTSASFAQIAKPTRHKPIPAVRRKIAAHTVFVCKDCNAYYSPTAAKQMGYKDGMGHKLTKMSKAPAGFMDGSKMKM